MLPFNSFFNIFNLIVLTYELQKCFFRDNNARWMVLSNISLCQSIFKYRVAIISKYTISIAKLKRPSGRITIVENMQCILNEQFYFDCVTSINLLFLDCSTCARTHAHTETKKERQFICILCLLNWIIIYKIAFLLLSQLISIECIAHQSSHNVQSSIREKTTETYIKKKKKNTTSVLVPRDLKLSFWFHLALFFARFTLSIKFLLWLFAYTFLFHHRHY